MLKALSTNKLANHPSYAKILSAYNMELQDKGKVNNLKFYRDVIVKEIPDYNVQSWYFFLKRYKTAVGIIEASATTMDPTATILETKNPKSFEAAESEREVVRTMLNNQDATAQAIARALNIGNNRLADILANPQLMSAKDAIDLIFKAMKAQDSRIHAVGKVREDNREEEKLARAFSDASYGS